MITSINEFLKNIKMRYDEGLIKTYDLESFIIALWKYFKKKSYSYKVTHDANYKMRFMLSIPANITSSDLSDIDRMCMLYGYFIAMIEYGDETYTLSELPAIEKYGDILIIIEPKFDNYIIVNKPVYHVTHELNMPKISELGLLPKSKCKLSHHPERVYVCKELEYCANLIEEFKKSELRHNRNDEGTPISINSNYAVLRINRASDILFYDDPNYFGKGYFTYENIPPSHIELMEIVKQ